MSDWLRGGDNKDKEGEASVICTRHSLLKDGEYWDKEGDEDTSMSCAWYQLLQGYRYTKGNRYNDVTSWCRGKRGNKGERLGWAVPVQT